MKLKEFYFLIKLKSNFYFLKLLSPCPKFDSWVGKFPWRRDRILTPVFLGLPGGSKGKDCLQCRRPQFNPWVGKIPGGGHGNSLSKESACNVGDLGLVPGLGRSHGKGKDYPLQYSGLENSMDSIVHGVAKHRTRLSDFHTQMIKNHPAMQDTWVWSLGLEDPLEKGMAIHSSILAWKIPLMVIHEWVTMPSSRGSSQPRGQTQVFCIVGRVFTSELPGNPKNTGG